MNHRIWSERLICPSVPYTEQQQYETWYNEPLLLLAASTLTDRQTDRGAAMFTKNWRMKLRILHWTIVSQKVPTFNCL